MPARLKAQNPTPMRGKFSPRGPRTPRTSETIPRDSPTVERILGEGGIRPLFEAVVVSDAVGWRKPRPVIFETAFRIMGITAEDCLFVGDRLDIDVAGARGVGMDAAWLNPERIPLPPGLAPPDYDVGHLSELGRALDGTGSVGANRA